CAPRREAGGRPRPPRASRRQRRRAQTRPPPQPWPLRPIARTRAASISCAAECVCPRSHLPPCPEVTADRITYPTSVLAPELLPCYFRKDTALTSGAMSLPLRNTATKAVYAPGPRPAPRSMRYTPFCGSGAVPTFATRPSLATTTYRQLGVTVSMAPDVSLPRASRTILEYRSYLMTRSTSGRNSIRGPCCASVGDRKSTRLNSSHVKISYAVFCLKKKTCARARRKPVVSWS